MLDLIVCEIGCLHIGAQRECSQEGLVCEWLWFPFQGD